MAPLFQRFAMLSTAVNKIIRRHLYPAIKCLTICPISCFTQTAVSWQGLLTMTCALHKDRHYTDRTSVQSNTIYASAQREWKAFHVCFIAVQLFITFECLRCVFSFPTTITKPTQAMKARNQWTVNVLQPPCFKKLNGRKIAQCP